MITYAGIDVGKDGALVGLDAGLKVVAAVRTRDLLASGEYDDRAMLYAIKGMLWADDVTVAIEAQQAMPKQGLSSTLSLGLGWGLWRGLVMNLPCQVTVVHVRPQAWQKVVLVGQPGKGKSRSVLVASSRLPGLELRRGKERKAHDGLADAACLALFAGWKS
jgi:hypothetical protein